MERRKLPYLDIVGFKGEFSKANPELLDPSQLRILRNGELYSVYGAIRKIRGNKPLLVNAEAGAISWVGQQKYPDLNGKLKRRTIFVSDDGDAFKKLEDDGTVTTLKTGLSPLIPRTSDQLDQHLYITGQDPLNVGGKDSGRAMHKYDGYDVLSWGVTAPGEIETVREGFDDYTTWTAIPVVGTPQNSSEITWDGTGSIHFYNSGGDTCAIAKAIPAFAPTIDVPNRGRIYVYLDPQYYQNNVNLVINFVIGSSGADYYRYDLSLGNFAPGWNIIPIDFSLPDSTAGTPDTANFDYIQLTAINTGITPIQGVYFDRFVTLDRGTPSLNQLYSVENDEDYTFENVPSRIIIRADSTGPPATYYDATWIVTAVPGDAALTAAGVVVDTTQFKEGTGGITWSYTTGRAAAETVNLTGTIANQAQVPTDRISSIGFWVWVGDRSDAPTASTTPFITVSITDSGAGTVCSGTKRYQDIVSGWNWIEFPAASTGAGRRVTAFSITFDYTASNTNPTSYCSIDAVTAFYDSHRSSLGTISATPASADTPQNTNTGGNDFRSSGQMVNDCESVANWTVVGPPGIAPGAALDNVRFKEGSNGISWATKNRDNANPIVFTLAPTPYRNIATFPTSPILPAGVTVNLGTLTAIGVWVYIDDLTDFVPAAANALVIAVTGGVTRTTNIATSALSVGWNYVIADVSPALTGAMTQITFTFNFDGTVNDIDLQITLDRVTAYYDGEEDFLRSGQGNNVVLGKRNTSSASVVTDITFPSALDLFDSATSRYIPANGRWKLWVYVPTPANLTDPAMTVVLGDSAMLSSSSFSVAKSQITTSGWNEVVIDLTNPVASTYAGWDRDSVARARIYVNYISAGTREDGVRIDLFNHNEVTSGALVGTYTYKVTYETKYGIESNAGPISPSITAPLGGSQIQLTDIPVSDDDQVVARRIYRTVAGGEGEWLYLTTIRDNTTTTYTDTIADESLGEQTPPEAGSNIFDNSPPPRAGIVKVYNRTLFVAGDPLNPHVLYFSRDDYPDAFPLLNAFELDSRITGIYECYLGLMVTTDTDHWRILGSNPDFTLEKVIEEIGAVSPRSVGTGKLEGWSVDQYGLRLYNLQEMVRISEPIQDKYEDLVNRYDVHTVHSRRHNALIQFNKNSEGEYKENFLYTYPMDNMRQGGWSTIDIPQSNPTGGPESNGLYCNLDPLHAAEVEDADGNIKIYAASSDGQIYELFEKNTANWMSTDRSGAPILLYLRTRWMRLGEAGDGPDNWDSTGRITPRFFELRAQEQNGQDSTWTVTIETAFISQDNPNVSVTDTATLTIYIPAGAGLVRLPIRQKNAADYVRITIENNDVNRDVVLLGARLYFWVQPSQASIEPEMSRQFGS